MAYQQRISDLKGANLFWNRYGIEIAAISERFGPKDQYIKNSYQATFKDNGPVTRSPITGESLIDLLFQLGNQLLTLGAV